MSSRGGEGLPPDVIAQKILVPGGAFRMRHEFHSEGEKNRFFFVLNKDPQSDTVVLLATATSKIKEHKAKWPPDVLVEISPFKYQELEVLSIINCETARSFQKRDVRQWITQRKIVPLRPLPKAVLARLRTAIAQCKVLTPVDKQLALKDES